MSSPDRARDTIDCIASTVNTGFGIVELAVFGPDFVDSRAPTRGIVFTENVVKVAGQ